MLLPPRIGKFSIAKAQYAGGASRSRFEVEKRLVFVFLRNANTLLIVFVSLLQIAIKLLNQVGDLGRIEPVRKVSGVLC